MPTPHILLLAGPNGAGKSTAAPALLKGLLRVDHFVNADTIAQGLSAFAPERAAIAAGRIMLARLRELAAAKKSFAFETTLASRSFAPWIAEQMRNGYQFHLLFLHLPSADFAIQRVADRVRMGGHNVPEETIRRRHLKGLRNLFDLYMPLTTSWSIFDATQPGQPSRIATGKGATISTVMNENVLYQMRQAVKI